MQKRVIYKESVENDPSVKLGVAFFPDAKTQLVSNFLKVSIHEM